MCLDAVELLGHHQGRHTEVGQLCPHLAAGSGVAGTPGAHGAGQVGSAQRGVDAGREVTLLVVYLKVH